MNGRRWPEGKNYILHGEIVREREREREKGEIISATNSFHLSNLERREKRPSDTS